MVSFRSTLLRSRSCSTGDPLWISSWGQMHDFCFLSSTSALASHYLALCFFRSISSCFRLTVTSSVLVFHFRFLRLPLYLSPNLLWLPSRFLYLAFCLFLFALPWFTPTAVSQVIPLCFRFRDFPIPVHFLSSVSFSLLATWLSVSSVLFFLSLPHSGFSNVSVLPFGFTVFPILSCLISHAFLHGFDTWLSVCFLSSFPVSLPQLFHRCFPLSTFLRPFLCRDFLLAFSFLSSASARFKLLSILHFLFPSSWLPLCSGSHQCLSSSSVQPVSMLSFRFWYSAFCDSFLRSLFHLTVTTSMSQLFPYGSQLISLGLRFRFRLVGFGISSCFRCFPAVYLGVSQAAPLY